MLKCPQITVVTGYPVQLTVSYSIKTELTWLVNLVQDDDDDDDIDGEELVENIALKRLREKQVSVSSPVSSEMTTFGDI